jgi:hypothetical protein
VTVRRPTSNMEKLAQLFKDRTNPFHIYVCTGTVISANPLQVQFGDSIILTKDHLVVSQLYAEGFTVQYTDQTDDQGATVTRTLTIKDSLQQGDQVMLVPDGDHKAWYLVGKVGTVT